MNINNINNIIYKCELKKFIYNLNIDDFNNYQFSNSLNYINTQTKYYQKDMAANKSFFNIGFQVI